MPSTIAFSWFSNCTFYRLPASESMLKTFSTMDGSENAYKLFKVLFYQNIILITIVGAIQLFSSV